MSTLLFDLCFNDPHFPSRISVGTLVEIARYYLMPRRPYPLVIQLAKFGYVLIADITVDRGKFGSLCGCSSPKGFRNEEIGYWPGFLRMNCSVDQTVGDDP